MTEAGKKISDGAKRNVERRKARAAEQQSRKQLMISNLLKVLEADNSSAAERLEAVRLLKELDK